MVSRFSNFRSILIHGQYLNHVRFVRSKAFPAVPNPGIQNRLEVFQDQVGEEVSVEEMEDLENYETDFMNVHLSHKDHERELHKRQHSTRVKILEKKYFKPKKQPLLLTWEEGQQIRQLHQLNPEKWNVHSLSQSFPATASTIEKILKSKWQPTSAERVADYNKTVIRNWKMLYEGKLDLPEDLKNHLTKFTERKKIVLPPVDPHLVDNSPKEETVSKEFSSLISSTSLMEVTSVKSEFMKPSFIGPSPKSSEDETYVVPGKRSTSKNSLSTLDMYREKILMANKGDSDDRALVNSYINKKAQNDGETLKISSSEIGITKYKQANGLENKSSVIHNKIKIPSHLKGKGSLYRVDDCYYDVDGEFLYRVPGMDGRL